MSTVELLCIALGVSLSVHFGGEIYPEPVHMAGHFWFVMFETAAGGVAGELVYRVGKHIGYSN
ncbi:MAG: hypothetical protein ABSG66_04985 [Stellaceae bacterium]|jgi:hypothetical protein